MNVPTPCENPILFVRFINLHIRSIWETICDALHIPVARIFGSKFLECLHSSIAGMLVWTPPSPPPPLKCRFRQILALWVELVWTTTTPYPLPPPQMQIWTDLGTLGWVGREARMWRLITVSPVDTISFHSVHDHSKALVLHTCE